MTWATNRKNFGKKIRLPKEPELMYFRTRTTEFTPLNRHDATVMKRTTRMARKATGIAYFGQGAEWHHDWIAPTHDPLGPIAHTDWEMDAFLEGGWTK